MRFFATKADLEPGIRQFESQHRVKYVPIGVYYTEEIPEYLSALAIPGLGYAPEVWSPDMSSYIVLSVTINAYVNVIALSAGGMRYDVDPEDNPSAFMVQFGALRTDGRLIGGRYLFNSKEPDIRALCLEFAACVTSGFIQVRDPLRYPWQLGPEAFEMLKHGGTLQTCYSNDPVALSKDDIPTRKR